MTLKKSAPLAQIDIHPWTASELRLHKEAVARLETILKSATERISKKRGLTEEQLYDFMSERMHKADMTSVDKWVIVAYGTSAAEPHYHFKPGKSKLIRPGHFLLLDIWGKINRPEAPYADITHMYFIGNSAPTRFQKLWANLRESRDLALSAVKKNGDLPGAHLDGLSRTYLDQCGHKGRFIHGLGHDLGVDHPHGPGVNLSPRFPQKLLKGRGYTIEPGIYKKGAFGIRSEIDFFLHASGRVEVTTLVQNALPCISTP